MKRKEKVNNIKKYFKIGDFDKKLQDNEKNK